MVKAFKLKKLISPPLLPLSNNQRIRGAPAELAGAPKNSYAVPLSKIQGLRSCPLVFANGLLN